MRGRVAKGLEGTPILVLDCNAEFEDDPTRCQEMLDEVRATAMSQYRNNSMQFRVFVKELQAKK